MSDPIQNQNMKSPKDDTRSVEELIFVALNEPDENLMWDAIWALQYRATLEVLERAKELCHSDKIAERRLGADILGQLGVPERTFLKECLSILLEMLDNESNSKVLKAILIAMGHLHQADVIEPASRFHNHPDPGVRNGVVSALTGHENERAIEVLIELSQDEDTHVRDWATFGLGTQIDLDTPEIREALIIRLNDTDFDTRGEAIVGLAKRRDRRVIPAISRELTSGCVGSLVVEAVTLIPDPQFYPELIDLIEWWDVDKSLLNEAINACKPS